MKSVIPEELNWGRFAWPALASIAGLCVLWGCFTTIEAGTVGIPVTFGEVGSSVMNPGLHLKLPFFTSIVEMSTRLQKHPVSAAAASRDLQQPSTQVTVPLQFGA